MSSVSSILIDRTKYSPFDMYLGYYTVPGSMGVSPLSNAPEQCPYKWQPGELYAQYEIETAKIPLSVLTKLNIINRCYSTDKELWRLQTVDALEGVYSKERFLTIPGLVLDEVLTSRTWGPNMSDEFRLEHQKWQLVPPGMTSTPFRWYRKERKTK